MKKPPYQKTFLENFSEECDKKWASIGQSLQKNIKRLKKIDEWVKTYQKVYSILYYLAFPVISVIKIVQYVLKQLGNCHRNLRKTWLVIYSLIAGPYLAFHSRDIFQWYMGCFRD